METSFRLAPHHNSTLLQQIPIDIRASDATVGCKANPHKLAEPTRIVVPLGLRIAECLKNRIGLENLALEKT